MADEWDDSCDAGVEFHKGNKFSSTKYDDNGFDNGGDDYGKGGYGGGSRGGGGGGGRDGGGRSGGYGGDRNGGGGGGARAPRAGDWTCGGCGKSNFASRIECFSCHKEKDDNDVVSSGGGGMSNGTTKRSFGADDWKCGGCGKTNYANRQECFSCHEAKGDSGGDGGFNSDRNGGGGFGGGRGGGGGGNSRPGDWNCGGCGKNNFASRSECFSCHEPKGDASNGYNGSGGGGGAGGSEKPRAGQRPGDWTCPSCDKANFASRTSCFGCNEEKPEHLANQPGSDEKPKEFYIPPELPTDESEIFSSKMDQGSNFANYQNIPVKVSGENIPPPIRDFSSSGLREFLLTNVEKSGYKTPTPIQKYSIPLIMNGRDLMGCAQTGSGKTAAFLLPIINALLSDNREVNMGQPHVLIITPTRELCIQITEQAHKFAHGSYIKVQKIYGGTASRHQMDTLKGGIHILVATPGRLLDFVNRSYIGFQDIRFIVLDEADRMLDMGFINDIEKVMVGMPAEKQTLMYSATFPEEIQHLAGKYLKNYAFVAVGIVGGACTDVEQQILEVSGRQKRDKLREILGQLNDGKPKGVLVFVETKRSTDFLASLLSSSGYMSTSIHSDRLQKEREIALGDFKSGRMGILIATNVAARGLDIPNVQHVINFDMPKSIDEYVHRIGRTGRLGNFGKAITFFDAEKDSEIASKLVTTLKGANQAIPDFLEQYDFGGSGRTGNFGGQDIRKDDFRKGIPQAVPQEEDEEW